MGPLSGDSRALDTADMWKCVTRRAPSSSSRRATTLCGSFLASTFHVHAWSSRRNFFDGTARHAEGRDVERYGTWERAEEERRIRPQRRWGRSGVGCAVFTNPDKESRQTWERRNRASYIALQALSYDETRQRNLLSTLSILRFARLRQNTVTWSLHRVNGRYS